MKKLLQALSMPWLMVFKIVIGHVGRMVGIVIAVLVLIGIYCAFHYGILKDADTEVIEVPFEY